MLQKITITINAEKNTFIIVEIIGKKYLINWGDKCINQEFLHYYEHKQQYTIEIIASSIVALWVNNCGVADIHFYNCNDLYWLECSFNNLRKLDVSECRRLQILNCTDNLIDDLQTGKLKELEILRCTKNQLKELSLQNQRLQVLVCNENPLFRLNIKKCRRLCHIECRETLLSQEYIISSLPRKSLFSFIRKRTYSIKV